MLPPPPTPIDCNLRDFAFMPLDVVRLRDSDLAATSNAEVFRAAVLAWCVAWHQIPAASLPDDDAAIARLVGMGRDLKGWKKLRVGGALDGFEKCSDGRLYHGVVAEKANTAWQSKQSQRDRTEKARQARLLQIQLQKEKKRHLDDVTSSVVTVFSTPRDSVREQKKTEQQQQERADARLLGCFKEFYEAFPRKSREKAASVAYAAALAEAAPEVILAGAQRYAAETKGWDLKHILGPARWLQEACWTDRGVEPTKTAFNSPEEQEGQRLARERAYGVSE